MAADDLTLGELDRRIDTLVDSVRGLGADLMRRESCGILRAARDHELADLAGNITQLRAELEALRTSVAAERTARQQSDAQVATARLGAAATVRVGIIAAVASVGAAVIAALAALLAR
jgi:hypothetical protein